MTPQAVRIGLVFAITVAGLSVGNVLLKIGTDRLVAMAPDGFTASLRAFFLAWQLPLGIALMTLQFIGTLTLLGFGLEVSLVVPVLGLNYVFTALLGQWWLGERVDLTRWLGIAAIVVGVALIARGAQTGGPT